MYRLLEVLGIRKFRVLVIIHFHLFTFFFFFFGIYMFNELNNLHTMPYVLFSMTHQPVVYLLSIVHQSWKAKADISFSR